MPNPSSAERIPIPPCTPSTPSIALMQQTQSSLCKSNRLKRKKRLKSLIQGVSHLSRRLKRRSYYRLQFWMWRKHRQKCWFAISKAKKQVFGISSGSCRGEKIQSQKYKSKVVLHVGCNTKDSCRGTNCLLKLSHSASLSEIYVTSNSSQNRVTDIDVTVPGMTPLSLKAGTFSEIFEITNSLKLSETVKPQSTESDACGLNLHLIKPQTMAVAQSVKVESASGPLTAAPPSLDQAIKMNTDNRINRKKEASSQTVASLKVITKGIHEFLDDFYRIYGSFIPLKKRDVIRHLKRNFNNDFNDRKTIIFSEVMKYQTVSLQRPAPSFRVVYKKHTLTLDDLSTLADQNWLNDQVMNMYGELIMDSVNDKVHFLNSFFHKQLMTKGYDGVKRWTKQVDLFSKRLLFVPIHLEVHWCLVTADNVRKKICLYDSQGNALQKVARNILRYLMAEAKERKQLAFENGWAMSFNEKIPQQTNENDCGVFVLEYSRCLALGKPLQFSQRDIPNIRKRIYKELCDCKVHEQASLPS